MKKVLTTICSVAVIVGVVSIFVVMNRWGHDIKPPKNSYKFAIYIARDTGNGDKAYVVDEKPLVTDKDIAGYYWEDHRIELTKEFQQKPKSTKYPGPSSEYSGGSRILGAIDTDKAIIVVNGKKIYETVFPENPMRSYSISGKYEIRDIFSDNSIYIKSFSKNQKEDKRYDKKVYDVLKELGILKE